MHLFWLGSWKHIFAKDKTEHFPSCFSEVGDKGVEFGLRPFALECFSLGRRAGLDHPC